ncbi:hypothetical protein [Bauldia sp.]|uniref:hypothetical protein n=1 Tax=Bauldia sp. TaxID=2575872 RepID=UPI003BAD3D78
MIAVVRILILDPLGYVVSVIATGIAIFVALYGTAINPDLMPLFITATVGIVSAVGAFSFVPALIAIVLSEAFRLRSVFYWLAVGGAIGIGADLLAGPEAYRPSLGDGRLVIFLGAGFVGGLVYWAIAGRLAGGQRHQNSSTGTGLDPAEPPSSA